MPEFSLNFQQATTLPCTGSRHSSSWCHFSCAEPNDSIPESNAYCLGSMKSDRWYLYTSSLPQAPITCPVRNRPIIPKYPAFWRQIQIRFSQDHTLEILMTDMPQHVLDLFTRDQCVDGPDCTKVCVLGTKPGSGSECRSREHKYLLIYRSLPGPNDDALQLSKLS